MILFLCSSLVNLQLCLFRFLKVIVLSYLYKVDIAMTVIYDDLY